MKILFPLLFLVFASCHSQKKLVEKALEAKNPSFQKYLPGDGGGKGILFFVEFPHVSANISINWKSKCTPDEKYYCYYPSWIITIPKSQTSGR